MKFAVAAKMEAKTVTFLLLPKNGATQNSNELRTIKASLKVIMSRFIMMTSFVLKGTEKGETPLLLRTVSGVFFLRENLH